ncbi:NADH dehydrogenase, alpha subcomplex, subunit 2 [Wilcoxina mikolae CBS 423.85]|nr:NADH dehydrogenase, alpha subcomplex, subunit 2 [Wilcoxina mikolae CBS 423.85]
MATRYVSVSGLKELRFLFCQTGQSSAAVRQFLSKSYPVIKKHNPLIPILIREASGIHPKVFARYEFGKETQVPLSGFTDQEIADKITSIVNGTASQIV